MALKINVFLTNCSANKHSVGRFAFHLSFIERKVILTQPADNLRAKSKRLYKVLLKYAGACLTPLLAEIIRSKTDYVKTDFEICGRNVFLFFSSNKRNLFCFFSTVRTKK